MKFSFLDKKGQSMTFSVLYGTFCKKCAIDDIFLLDKKVQSITCLIIAKLSTKSTYKSIMYII